MMFRREVQRPNAQKKASAARPKSVPGRRVVQSGIQPKSVVQTYKPIKNKNGELLDPPNRPPVQRRRRTVLSESAEDEEDDADFVSEDEDGGYEDESYREDSVNGFEGEDGDPGFSYPTEDVTCICPKRKAAFKAAEIVTCLKCGSRQHLHCIPVVLRDWNYIDDTCCIACSERELFDTPPHGRRKSQPTPSKQKAPEIQHGEGRAELELQAIRSQGGTKPRMSNQKPGRKDSKVVGSGSNKKPRLEALPPFRGLNPRPMLPIPSPDSPSRRPAQRKRLIEKPANPFGEPLFVSREATVEKEDNTAEADGDNIIVKTRDDAKPQEAVQRQNIVCGCADKNVANLQNSVLCGRCMNLQHEACMVEDDQRLRLLKSPRCNQCKLSGVGLAVRSNIADIATMQNMLYLAGVEIREMAGKDLWKHYCNLPNGDASPTVITLTGTQAENGCMVPIYQAPDEWVEAIAAGIGKMLDAAGAKVGSEAFAGKSFMGDSLAEILKAWRELAVWLLHYGPFNGDKGELGVFAEVLGLVEKGTFWNGT